MAESKYFVDVFSDIVDAVRADYQSPSISTPDNSMLEPYYIYGHPREIAKRLSLKSKSAVDKFRKFPLVVLLQDFQEDHGNELRYDYNLSFTVLIVTNTESTYTSEERYINTFKPILYPIYELLLEKINESPELMTVDPNLIDHVKTDRLFWGAAAAYGNEGVIFNNFLDAIEINFNDIIIVKDNTCQT